MNNFSIKGKVESILDLQTIKDLKKQAVLVSNNEKKSDKEFTHEFHLEFLGDKTDLLNDVSVGDELTFHFNIRTNKYTKDDKTTYFTSLNVWKIDK